MEPTPVCGAPPIPGSAVWNSDPVLLTMLVLGMAATLWLTPPTGRRAGLAVAGWVVLLLALVSPLCSISVALFSMRVTQHLVITLFAAPLLAAALMRGATTRLGVALPTTLFAGLLWFWHLPVPYAATFASDGVGYWLMHVSLAGSAVWFWVALLRHVERRPVAATLGALATAIQMGVLGALLTFAPRPIYAPHAQGVTLPWDLTPLEDQQLGGLLMWVPGGMLFVLVLGLGLAMALRTSPQGTALRLVMALSLSFAAPAALMAQGNDSTTASSAPSEGGTTSAPVGVLTTSSVTTGSSGPSAHAQPVPEGADRRTRVLGSVCAGLDGPVLEDCRTKSGL